MTLDFSLGGVGNVFRSEQESDVNKRIVRLPLSELHQHPQLHVTVPEDSYLTELTESIKANGILEDIRVFPDPLGGYWIISGRHRAAAAKLAGMTEVDCIIDDDMTQETAEIAITDANLRHELSPMERAQTLRIKHDAEVKQGRRSDRTESDRTMFRYIRLTYLINDLQDRTELTGKAQLKVRTGAALSYLSEELQWVVNEQIDQTGKLPTMEIAEDWKRNADTLTGEQVVAWFAAPAESKTKSKKISVPYETIARFVPANYTQSEVEALLVQLLMDWHDKERPLPSGQ